MWSLGVSFYEILTLKTVFPQTCSTADLWKLIEAFDTEQVADGKIGAMMELKQSVDSVHTELLDDIADLLRNDPMIRPSAACLASRESMMIRISRIIMETSLAPMPEKHMQEFKDLLSTSRRAEDLEPAIELNMLPSGTTAA